MFTKHPFVLYRVEHTHPLLLGIFQSKGGLNPIKNKWVFGKQNKTKEHGLERKRKRDFVCQSKGGLKVIKSMRKTKQNKTKGKNQSQI